MARSLFDAINAASAALQNATMDENQNTTRTEAVRPNRPTAKPTPKPSKPKAAPKAEPKADPSLEDAIKAAAAKVEGRPTPDPSRNGGEKAGAKKAAPKTDTPKTKGGKSAEKPKPIDINSLQCKYAIPEDFKMAIRLYMEGRAAKDNAIARKMKAAGKSIDGCCEYIYGVMMRRAAQQLTERKSTGIGLTGSPEEVYGLAMHYYDESEENLKAELKGEA